MFVVAREDTCSQRNNRFRPFRLRLVLGVAIVIFPMKLSPPKTTIPTAFPLDRRGVMPQTSSGCSFFHFSLLKSLSSDSSTFRGVQIVRLAFSWVFRLVLESVGHFCIPEKLVLVSFVLAEHCGARKEGTRLVDGGRWMDSAEEAGMYNYHCS